MGRTTPFSNAAPVDVGDDYDATRKFNENDQPTEKEKRSNGFHFDVELHNVTLAFPTKDQEEKYMESQVVHILNWCLVAAMFRSGFNFYRLSPETTVPAEIQANESVYAITWWMLYISTVMPLAFLFLVAFFAFCLGRMSLTAHWWRLAILSVLLCELGGRCFVDGLIGQSLPQIFMTTTCGALITRLHWYDHVTATIVGLAAYIVAIGISQPQNLPWKDFVETLGLIPVGFAISYFSDRKLRLSYYNRQCLAMFQTQLSRAEQKLHRRHRTTKVDTSQNGHVLDSTSETESESEHSTMFEDPKPTLRKKKSRRTNSSTDLADVLHRATQVQDMLVESAQRKSFFLATMSHELRTPLAALLGCADLLDASRGHFTDDENALLSLIHSSGDHLLAIVNDILDFSKLANSSTPFRLEPIVFNPHRLSTQILASFSHQASKKGVDLRMDTAGVPSSTTRLFGDRTRIVQIITNLVGNAIKFTATDGSVTVRFILARCRESEEVACHVADDDVPKHSSPNILTVEVTDSGIGMSQEVISKLFRPFSQGQEGITREYGGTGLGLSITSELVKLMGGQDVEVESEVGHGSTFRVNLKIREVSPMTPLTTARSFTRLQNTAPATHIRTAISGRLNITTPLSHVRVLLVDDVRSIRMIGQRLLEGLGAAVEVAEDGEKALAAVVEAKRRGDDQSFHFVLMDMHMPGMDGVQTTAAIVEATKGWTQLPIVIGLTADVLEEAEAGFLKAGATTVLTKPFNVEKLRQTMTSLRPINV